MHGTPLRQKNRPKCVQKSGSRHQDGDPLLHRLFGFSISTGLCQWPASQEYWVL